MLLYITYLNRWCGDNGNDAFTESPGCWEPDEKQVVKWTAEGAVKCESFSFTEYSATLGKRINAGDMLVSCQSARVIPWIKVAPRIVVISNCSSLTESRFLSGIFLCTGISLLDYRCIQRKSAGRNTFWRRKIMLLTKRWRPQGARIERAV